MATRRRKKLSEPQLLVGLMAAMWVIQGINFVSGQYLTTFGIVPRTLFGLVGIAFAPFLHGSWSHLIVNTVPFLVLGGLITLGEKRRLLDITIFVALVGGALVWLLGRGGSVHAGVSGVIFGYFGYLLTRGISQRSFSSFLIALVTLLLYGGILFGALPRGGGISWESHLFGLVAGFFAARAR